jgi:hypothetical protein
MSVKFGAPLKSSGLDTESKPFPAMIVPLRDSHLIKVFGPDGLSLFDDRELLGIKELDRSAIVLKDIGNYGVTIAMGFLIASQLSGNPRYFQITGKGLGDKAGTTVRVAPSRRAKAEGSLRVVVLKQRPLKLSIRPVQVRNDKGNLVFHCQKNYDPKALLRRINSIWTPQTNILFGPASFDPAILDDQAAIAKVSWKCQPQSEGARDHRV